uniref:Uncharacterized protein n=1 Tax=Candidatus Kentrum sp. FM TaxID=2126340 RepID=A0A450WS71_9GAMM|nr:MAG: hypothetical protein BECKFM1743A_GA0114220_106221 [Candidatus Kentron sp. FM]VFJ72452.1 MAG: hypothetical protein BECKFM1743C_GA0114222_106546 [Candidatus Kentron sp. FM]VFK19885.1 MAG: hypothetical protein BECKFM1743B_GA0114221_106526 [Candidatus Kentron sp. FM]
MSRIEMNETDMFYDDLRNSSDPKDREVGEAYFEARRAEHYYNSIVLNHNNEWRKTIPYWELPGREVRRIQAEFQALRNDAMIAKRKAEKALNNFEKVADRNGYKKR